MSLLQHDDDRSVEASPARRARAIEAGGGPRAPWLASAITGLLAIALLSLAAGPVAAGAKGLLRASLVADAAPIRGLEWRAALLPAVLAALAVLAAAAAGHALAHGGWTRLGPWRAGRRAPWTARIRGAAAGWMFAIAALVGGVLGAAPWIGALPELLRRPLPDAAWAAALFVIAAALGALLAALAMGFLQLRLAMRAFDRTLRMTRSEAQREDRERGPRRAPQSRWRLA